jgi:hypothetical protein
MHSFLSLLQQAITGNTPIAEVAMELASHLWFTLVK